MARYRMRYRAAILVLLVLYVSPAYWIINHTLDGQAAAFTFAFWSILFAPAAGITLTYLRWRDESDE